ncbi:hypothetical protein HT031_004643 [Scenedesmus sp. PABB004]|nr:hypothetical protein HT031_004643 [Scenedesmus sp. PABB004]
MGGMAVTQSPGGCRRCAGGRQHPQQRRRGAALLCRAVRPSRQLAELLQQQPMQQQTQTQQDKQQQPHQPTPQLGRRAVAVLGPAAGALAAALALARPAAASKLGGLVDDLWQTAGGGPADLTFPEAWSGVWDVTSTLVSVSLPLGEELVPNLQAVRRAQAEDLDRPLTYQVAFVRGPGGRVIFDRRFNTAALLKAYYGSSVDFAGRIRWDPSDPNELSLSMPGDLSVRTRVMRRSEEEVGPGRFETSEFSQQVFESAADTSGVDPGARPRVKASQCFTKFLWRDDDAAAAAGGPPIVATQGAPRAPRAARTPGASRARPRSLAAAAAAPPCTCAVVSDYLTPFDGSEAQFLAARNRPVSVYTYKLAFTRHHDAAPAADIACS